jgi:hypothetical protein
MGALKPVGDEDKIPVVEDGIGVGYFRYAPSCSSEEKACRFEARGKPGEEENGSNAGRREGTFRLAGTIEGSADASSSLTGDDSMM